MANSYTLPPDLVQVLTHATRLTLTVVGSLILLGPGAALAQSITNGGFEDGPLFGAPTGWTAGGTAQIEVLRATDFTVSGANNIVAPEGAQFVLLSTGPGDQSGAAADVDGNGIADDDIATLSQVIDGGAGGTVLSFKWAFLTSEADEALEFDDLFRISLDGTPILTGSVTKPGGSSPYPDTPVYDAAAGQRYDGTAYTVDSTGATDGSFFGGTANNGFSGWNLFSIIIPPGAHTLELLVADQNDASFDSGLLVDDVTVVGGQSLFQLTDTAGSFVEAKAGGIVWRPFQSTSPTVSNDGFTFSFLSSGNLTGDNPSGQQQVVTVGDAAVARLTSMVDGTASRPSLSADGRYVAYAAQDDPLGTNADLNQEIFLGDRTAGTTIQITSTSGCSNSSPSVSSTTPPRIAFQSTCSGISGASNTDGNAEIVLWDGAAFRSMADTSSCTSRSPDLAAGGDFVAFVSSCNYAGANDGNEEIFRWDLVTPAVEQLTSTVSGGGVLVDGASISQYGARVVFVSNGNLDGGALPPFGYEVFLWRSGGTITRLTDSGLKLNIVARLDDSGNFVAVEQLDLLGGPSDILLLGIANPTSPGISTLATGATVSLPDIGIDSGASEAVVVFQAQDDLVTGGNADGNWEIYTSRLAVQSGIVTYCSTPNLAIPDKDNTGVTDTITVPATVLGNVQDVDVYLRIDHTWVGDLQAYLSHGAVTDIRIVQRPRADAVNQLGSCPGDNIDVVLDDEGARDIRHECSVTPPAIGSPPNLIPYDGTLNAFDGTPAQGAWSLTVLDRSQRDVGTFIEWCVIITPGP